MRKIEQILQMNCVTWFNWQYPKLRGLLFMNHNTPRNAIDGVKLKAMGLVAGVADMTFLYDSKAYFIELKTKTGKQSPKQIEWQKTVSMQRFSYTVVRSLDEFKDLINGIILNSDIYV